MENSTSAEPVAENLMTLSQWIEAKIKVASTYKPSDRFGQGYHFAITELKAFLESRQDTEFTGYDIFGPAR